ncbi:protein maelstrom homolog [Hyposmocoma kahamanoa]|uniref:protein maelstrom homolog n=1 Tax=Hyposmocoma kahamanoa TaxID=1477025 RepID=UPI000E6D99EF|nr:protein maelstrom homolog [Hyposmocoma kahamanoa]
MPKKQPRNSFYYFMIDFKEEQRKKGTVYANMAEVANAAGPAWTSAPPPLRAKYEAIAKVQKQKQNVPEKKFTSTGVSLAEIAQQDAERKDAMEAEREDIHNFVVQKSVNKSIANEDIYLIDVNYYCKTSTHYLIGEFTLLRFSLQDGIKNTYHELINPGIPPVGYALDVKLGCQEYGLEMPDDHSKPTNYMQVLANVVDYLKQQDAKMPSPPPVFTMPDKVEPVLDFLQFLCSGVGEDDNQFRVYKLDTLLFMVANTAAGGTDEGFPKESLALVQLKKDSFKYTPELGCEMHERGELAVQCTSSRVKRWAYTVMDWCCPLLGVEALPGTHVPADFDVDLQKKRNAPTRR